MRLKACLPESAAAIIDPWNRFGWIFFFFYLPCDIQILSPGYPPIDLYFGIMNKATSLHMNSLRSRVSPFPSPFFYI